MTNGIVDRAFPRELGGLNEAMRRVRPGGKVELVIGLNRNIDASELNIIGSKLTEGGLLLTGPLTIGSTAEWPNALKIDFVASERKGIGFWPVAIAVVGALSFIGIAGWGLAKVTESFSKNLVPIVLIGVAGLVAYGYVTRKK